MGKESQRVTGCNAIRARAREPPPEMSLREIPSGRGEPAGNGNVALLAHMRESPLGNAIANIPSGGRESAGNRVATHRAHARGQSLLIKARTGKALPLRISQVEAESQRVTG